MRPVILRQKDNLAILSGDFGRRADNPWIPGDRATVVKRRDNLEVGGQAAFAQRLANPWTPGEKVREAVGSVEKG